jgi:hypothetical protein
LPLLLLLWAFRRFSLSFELSADPRSHGMHVIPVSKLFSRYPS